MEQINQIRAAVADVLAQKGRPNREFLDDIRNGRRDDGPYMQGAIAWASQADVKDHAKHS